MSFKVLSVFGTRPEAIKMAPVVLALDSSSKIESKVCVTAQHRQMLDQVLSLFNITPDYDLDVMQANQDLYDITSRILLGLRDVLKEYQPDLVLVHGDTTTCFAVSLAAFYQQIPVGHVEAGLRTGDLSAPFPEEANRSLVGRLAQYHFAPTELSRQNLLSESIDDQQITVTGNTVIDALLWVKQRLASYDDSVWQSAIGGPLFARLHNNDTPMILITGHRRENFGQGFVDLCSAIKQLAEAHSDWEFVYPVHLNPNVQQPVYDILAGLGNVSLIDPQDYLPFTWLMNRSALILTDSGGIQEETTYRQVPCITLRPNTERPSTTTLGTNQMLTELNVAGVMHAIDNPKEGIVPPLWDGHATERIVDIIRNL